MKIAALVSGGVDSSVALALLNEEKKHDITAFYLKIWLEEELSFLGECPWEEDLEYVRLICDQLNIPLQVVPLQREYYDRVVSYTIAELKEGRTPSPDIFCNQRIKFGAFYDRIDKSYEKIATGHYAQIEEIGNHCILKRAPDPVKDQTYFLAHLSQEQIQRILFPIGGMQKSEVRALAQKYDLPNKDRKDSQGICFLGKIKFNEFIEHHLGEKKGDIVDYKSRKKLGEHKGFWYHTIGQRRGLGLGGGPWYVVQKDLDKNIVYVSHKDDMEDWLRYHFSVANFNWIHTPPEKENLSLKIRHGRKLYNCKLKFQGKDRAEVTLEEEDPGIAPGQFSVFYDEEICLGCASIEGSFPRGEL